MDIDKTIWYIDNAKWLRKELLPYDVDYHLIGFNPNIHGNLTKILPRFGTRFWLIDIWTGKRYDAYMNIKQYQISSLKPLYNDYPDIQVGDIIGSAINPENKDEVIVDFKYTDENSRRLIKEVKRIKKEKEYNKKWNQAKIDNYYYQTVREIKNEFEKQKLLRIEEKPVSNPKILDIRATNEEFATMNKTDTMNELRKMFKDIKMKIENAELEIEKEKIKDKETIQELEKRNQELGNEKIKDKETIKELEKRNQELKNKIKCLLAS